MASSSSSHSSSSSSSSSILSKLQPDTTVKVIFSTNKTTTTSDDDAVIPRFVLGYWSIRGLAAPLRMMLSAAKVNHWVILYDATEVEGNSDWSKESWLHDKAWLKTEHNPFANLPFLMDVSSGKVINQSNAIFTYLGRALNMLGNSNSKEDEPSKCEELLCEIMDVRNCMVNFAYGSRNEIDTAASLVQRVAACHWEKFELHLTRKYANESSERCGTFLVGDSLSAPDFHLWEMLDQYESLCQFHGLPPLLANFPFLQTFKQNFAAQPQNQAYFRSFLGKELPFNNPYAHFASSPGAKLYVRGQATPWQKRGVIVFETE